VWQAKELARAQRPGDGWNSRRCLAACRRVWVIILNEKPARGGDPVEMKPQCRQGSLSGGRLG